MADKIMPPKIECTPEVVQGCSEWMAAYLVGPGSRTPLNPKFLPTQASSETERQKLEAAERAALGPVKQYILRSEYKLSWDDVVGNEEAHRAMIEAIEFPVKHAALFKHYDKKMTKGILLKGPPGCGKTMLGKAAASVIAQLYGVKESSILSIKATELQKPYVGQTEEIIRDIFAYARAYRALHGHQLVVFIDEADAILPARNGQVGTRGAAGWEESNVATFLVEMDGMEESGALLILATNRPNAIDAAILRDGRIDRKITVKRPSEGSARIILTRALANVPVQSHNTKELVDIGISHFFDPMRHLFKVRHSGGVDYMTLASVVSGAMMVGLAERAKGIAFHRDITEGTMTGVNGHDIVAAVEAITTEQREQLDQYALLEMAQRLNTPILEIDQVTKVELKYTGSLQ